MQVWVLQRHHISQLGLRKSLRIPALHCWCCGPHWRCSPAWTSQPSSVSPETCESLDWLRGWAPPSSRLLERWSSSPGSDPLAPQDRPVKMPFISYLFHHLSASLIQPFTEQGYLFAAGYYAMLHQAWVHSDSFWSKGNDNRNMQIFRRRREKEHRLRRSSGKS